MSSYILPVGIGALFAVAATAFPPWAVAGVLAAVMVANGLRHEAEMRRLRERIEALHVASERTRTAAALRDMGIEVLPEDQRRP